MIIIDFSRGKHDFLFPVAGISDGFASHSLSQAKSGTHSPSSTGLHTRAYTVKQVVFRMGALSPPSERSARSPTSPGRVSERRTLPLLSLGRVYARRTQRASEQRCAYACRCSEASRPRWAAHTYAVNTSIFPAEFFSQSQKTGKKSHSLMFHIHVFDRTA